MAQATADRTMTHKEKLKILEDYLREFCTGWECRILLRVLRVNMAKRGARFSDESLQHATTDLRLSGVPVCSDDTSRKGGVFVARCRREMLDFDAQLERRIRGTVRTQNCNRKLMNELFPEEASPQSAQSTTLHHEGHEGHEEKREGGR